MKKIIKKKEELPVKLKKLASNPIIEPSHYSWESKATFNYNENVPKIDYLSGGGWSGGCEDPRLVLIDDIVYMIFTAFDGWGSVRLALTSIKFEDFK